MVRHTGRKGCRAAEMVSRSVYDPSGTFKVASLTEALGGFTVCGCSSRDSATGSDTKERTDACVSHLRILIFCNDEKSALE